MTKSDCVFYAVGTRYVYDALEVAERAGIHVRAFIHNRPEAPVPEALDPVLTPDQVDVELTGLPVAFPLVTPGYRKRVEEEASKLGFRTLASLIDPSAVVARRFECGSGVQVNAGVVIAAGCTFGRQVLVNRSASIGHDVTAEDYVSFGPGCTLCGSCYVEAGVFVGAGSTLAPGVRIGRNAIVGAGAVVIRDVPAGAVAAGNPARVMREGIAGYNDCGV